MKGVAHVTIQAHSIRTGLVALAIVLALASLVIVAQFALHPHLLSGLLGGSAHQVATICGGGASTPC